ncbi:DUF3349 domain-containing protein [Gordonia sp. L191]|uniref:DUF3349 domain-containing protein n=1 Tax=Gordonia TaxID=2053 RepID=UPI000B99D937|nr:MULTISPECIES: DUF3349 domain-containing protein [Gordonia]OZC29150.1 hypothetical protein CJJ17_25440 [Gordonia polyisoprenivorans]UZF57544.1 DUF3349 domain-containing protein [Gordonia polyisoprenivorans]WHU45884.1 DUF3349 domain-containing protein [Gordonia sp. L191]
MSSSLFDSAVNWIRKGYPDGVPPTDFPPLLALLMRTLTEEEVTNVALVLAKDRAADAPVTPERIKQAILEVTETQPTDAEINQVASRLAAVGWPLAASPATA